MTLKGNVSLALSSMFSYVCLFIVVGALILQLDEQRLVLQPFDLVRGFCIHHVILTWSQLNGCCNDSGL